MFYHINNPAAAIGSAFEKGKPAAEGETRDWQGKKFRKEGGKWKEVTDPKGGSKKDDPKEKGSPKPDASSGGKSTPPSIDNHEVAQMTHMKSVMDSDPDKAYEIYQSLSPEAQAKVPQDEVNKLVSNSHAEKKDGLDYDALGKDKKKDGKPSGIGTDHGGTGETTKEPQAADRYYSVVKNAEENSFVAAEVNKYMKGKVFTRKEHNRAQNLALDALERKKSAEAQAKPNFKFSDDKKSFQESVSRMRGVHDSLKNAIADGDNETLKTLGYTKKQAQEKVDKAVQYLNAAKDHKKKLDGAESGAESFKHDRMMAGYHSVKEKEYLDQADDLSSSSDPDLKKDAKALYDKADAESKKASEFQAKAKKSHDPKRDGDWNSTMPSAEDSLKYGGSQKLKKAMETLGI